MMSGLPQLATELQTSMVVRFGPKGEVLATSRCLPLWKQTMAVAVWA